MPLIKPRTRGKQLVTEANLLARRAPQVKISDRVAYGLGMFLNDSLGVPVYGHGGNTIGFTSDLIFLPDHDVGLVVLTNAGSANSFRSAVQRKFLELVFEGKPEAEAGLTFALAQAKSDAAAYLKLAERLRAVTEGDVRRLRGP